MTGVAGSKHSRTRHCINDRLRPSLDIHGLNISSFLGRIVMSKLSWRRTRQCVCLCFVTVFSPCVVFGAALVSLRGVVHDPDHLPIPSATVTLRSITSDYK